MYLRKGEQSDSGGSRDKSFIKRIVFYKANEIIAGDHAGREGELTFRPAYSLPNLYAGCNVPLSKVPDQLSKLTVLSREGLGGNSPDGNMINFYLRCQSGVNDWLVGNWNGIYICLSISCCILGACIPWVVKVA